MTEIKEPTYHTCKHGRMIWSDEDENDNREPCIDCTLDYYRGRIAALEKWQKEAVPYLCGLSDYHKGIHHEIERLIEQSEGK